MNTREKDLAAAKAAGNVDDGVHHYATTFADGCEFERARVVAWFEAQAKESPWAAQQMLALAESFRKGEHVK
jgi:hypothetical protein